MNDRKNTIIGFTIIGLILILFSWYNTKKMEEAAEAQKKVQDSLALVQRVAADTLADSGSGEVPQLSVAQDDEQIYGSDTLATAFAASEEFYTISNDKLSVTVTSKGAQPYRVHIREFYPYDSTDLFLIDAGSSSLNYDLNTVNQWISTKDLNFSLISSSPSSVSLRLAFDDSSYVQADYSLADGSYMLDYSLRFVGMDDVLEPGTTGFNLKWIVDMPRLEKGYKNEKNYSGVAYRYAGENGEVKNIGQRKDSASETFSSRLSWVGFQQQFFSAIIVADNDFSGGDLVNRFYPETDPDRRLMQSAANLSLDYDMRSGDFNVPMHFYFGPNHFPTMKAYDRKFERIIPLGKNIIGAISRYVIIPVFNWLSRYFTSYGIIILILTLIIKIVISPLTWKSYMSSAKMKVLKPEVDKIASRYPKQEDAMKKQQATMELYRKADVNMMGGCLPILLQFPILWAMFRFFPASFELRQHPFLWADDLSGYDSILDFGFNVPLFGDHFSLFAFLMAVTMFFYTRITMQGQDTSAMPGMKFMNLWFMPIMMWFLCNNFSAGLSYYYMLSNLITILQNWVIRKWFVDEKKIYEKLQTAQAKPVKKSKFQQRIDEMYRIQQQQQKQQKNR